MAGTVTVREVERLLAGAGEFAFLDVRETIPYSSGHALWAFNLPLSWLELRIGWQVPRRDTEIVLIDAGDGLAERAAARLSELGYAGARLLEGGNAAWEAAGHPLCRETQVQAKAFAGFAERAGALPAIEPAALKAAMDAGEDWIVLDARPRAEYQAGSIPGSIDAPGPEALRCFADLVPRPTTKVAVNCTTRTRGILGTLALRAAGVPNPVFALRNGTRGWRLSGLAVEKGASRFAPPPSPAALAAAQERVAGLLRKAGVPRTDRPAVERWREEAGRTTYLLDVRDPAEFAAGHLPGAVNAPHGNLVMGPEDFFATANPRVVVTDTDGVRAGLTALWLAQMGRSEPAVLVAGEDELSSKGPDLPPVLGLEEARSPAVFAGRLPDGATVIDLSFSRTHEEGHVPGARWAIRSRLGASLARLPGTGPVVLTSEDGSLARLASAELQGGSRQVLVLEGGNAAWRESGCPMEKGFEHALDPPDDRWLPSDERPGDVDANQQAYIDWESGLYSEIQRDGPPPFRNLL